MLNREWKKRNFLQVFIVIVLILNLGFTAFLGYKVIYDDNAKSEPLITNGADQDKNISINDSLNQFISNSNYNIESDLSQLVNQVSPSVVTVVTNSRIRDYFTDEITEVETGVGTGFFISEDGLLITNEHVVCGASKNEVTIIDSQKQKYKITSIQRDPIQDIAIIKVGVTEPVPYLKFINHNDQIEIGQGVIAVGNPLGINPGSVTSGIISGLDRNITAQGECDNRFTSKQYEGVLQTDAAINSGNSGGPLINLKGEVVGVNTATSSSANNISYAIPAQGIIRIIDRYIKNNGELKFPYIGVKHRMIDSNLSVSNEIPYGAYIVDIVEGSPADKSGLKKGDIITSINDKEVNFSLQTTLNRYFDPGDEVELSIFRPIKEIDFSSEDIKPIGREVKIKVVLGEQ